MVKNIFVNKSKKGISVLISYVLLVTLAIALAGLTYYFIIPYASNPLPEEKCPDGVSLIIESYNCSAGNLDLTLKNTGRHNITGVFVKIVNKTDNLEYLIKDIKPNLNLMKDVLPVGEELEVLDIDYGNADIEKIILIPYKIFEEEYATLCSEAILSLNVPAGTCN